MIVFSSLVNIHSSYILFINTTGLKEKTRISMLSKLASEQL